MSRTTRLSRQEHAVIELAAHGATQREIAEALSIGVETVRNYRVRAYEKLGAANVAHAVYLAVSRGLIRAEHQSPSQSPSQSLRIVV